MEILYFAVWCRPFHNYWALPAPNVQCTSAVNHLITYAVFNISSDLVMLLIGFSLFIGNNLPWNRKIILCFVFGLGIFVILSSILNKYYSFTHPFGSQWTFWYVRESSTALIVANLPFLWPLLRRIFNLKNFDGSSDAGSQPIRYHGARSARARQRGHVKSLTPTQTALSSAHRHAHSISFHSPPLSSPTRSPHTSLAIDTDRAKQWKQQGVFGREDADALAFDPWDYGNDEDVPVDAVTVRSEESMLGSVESPRRKRLRDEEASIAMQERTSPTYRDFEKELEEVVGEEEVVAGADLEKGKGVREDTEAFGDDGIGEAKKEVFEVT